MDVFDVVKVRWKSSLKSKKTSADLSGESLSCGVCFFCAMLGGKGMNIAEEGEDFCPCSDKFDDKDVNGWWSGH
jgi:hypothetical protein